MATNNNLTTASASLTATALSAAALLLSVSVAVAAAASVSKTSSADNDDNRSTNEELKKTQKKDKKNGKVNNKGSFWWSSSWLSSTTKSTSQQRCEHCSSKYDDMKSYINPSSSPSLLQQIQYEKRCNLPSIVILVRHGESESNADHTLWRTKPDNMIELSPKGIEQANQVGRKIEQIFQNYEDSEEEDRSEDEEDGSLSDDSSDDSTVRTRTTASVTTSIRSSFGGSNLNDVNNNDTSNTSETRNTVKRVHLIVSPFERSIQTSQCLRTSIEHRIVRTEVEPRIREQEFGNIQNDNFSLLRKEQTQTGRFWYRFPTGESGADVHDRVKSWWYESVMEVNNRYGYEPIDALVVVTHGLTMRFVLMTLFNWSPNTFHTIWNANNCDYYVLRKDLNKAGNSPYVLDISPDRGGMYPKSSINVIVELRQHNNNNNRSNGDDEVVVTKDLTLQDYLGIPPPRTTRLNLIKGLLKEQYPGTIKSVDDIISVTIAPTGATTTSSSTSETNSIDGTSRTTTPITSQSAPDLRRLGSRTIKQIESSSKEKQQIQNCKQRPRLDHLRFAQLETSTRFPHLSPCYFSPSTTASQSQVKTPPTTLLDNLEQDPKEWRIA